MSLGEVVPVLGSACPSGGGATGGAFGSTITSFRELFVALAYGDCIVVSPLGEITAFAGAICEAAVSSVFAISSLMSGFLFRSFRGWITFLPRAPELS